MTNNEDTPHQPRTQGFYLLTSETAQLLRGADLTAAEWRLWSYLVSLDPFGDRYQEMPDLVTVLEECHLSKPTFYRAIAKLQEAELFDIQPIRTDFRNLRGTKKLRTDNSLKNENSVSRMRTESQKRESNLKNENELSEMRIESQKRENRSSEPLPSEEFRSPQTYSDYSEDLKSLSEAARETNGNDPEFKEWLRRKASQLPKPPQLVEQWIAKQAKIEANQREFKKHKLRAEEIIKVPPPPPNRFQIEISCMQAHDQGDRGFILAKLQQLWREGWHDLIEELCQLYPTWGVAATSNGVVEADQ